LCLGRSVRAAWFFGGGAAAPRLPRDVVVGARGRGGRRRLPPRARRGPPEPRSRGRRSLRSFPESSVPDVAERLEEPRVSRPGRRGARYGAGAAPHDTRSARGGRQGRGDVPRRVGAEGPFRSSVRVARAMQRVPAPLTVHRRALTGSLRWLWAAMLTVGVLIGEARAQQTPQPSLCAPVEDELA